jgi:hypothetical protein
MDPEPVVVTPDGLLKIIPHLKAAE